MNRQAVADSAEALLRLIDRVRELREENDKLKKKLEKLQEKISNMKAKDAKS